MNIDHILAEIQARHIILQKRHECLGVWAPNTSLPPNLWRAIRRYRPLLLTLIDRNDVRACPSPNLHRRYWRYVPGARIFVCDKCGELAPYLQAS